MIRNLLAFYADVIRPLTHRRDDTLDVARAVGVLWDPATPPPADAVWYVPPRERAALHAQAVRDAAWDRIGRYGDSDLGEWEYENGWVQ